MMSVQSDDVGLDDNDLVATHTVAVTNLGFALTVDHIQFRNADTADTSIAPSLIPLPTPTSRATSSTKSASTSQPDDSSVTSCPSSRDGSESTMISNSHVASSETSNVSSSASPTTLESTQKHNLSLRGTAALVIGTIMAASIAVLSLSCVVTLLWLRMRRWKQEEENKTCEPSSSDPSARLERGCRVSADDRPLTGEVASWRWSPLHDEDPDQDIVQSRTTSLIATVGDAVVVPSSLVQPGRE
ncbi:hypothetical protein C8Q76DRAFT_220214 [Earliella scabrosa]|nr:hypothetical protein C8Q76DRAFT_220214 [Earliella scabrosa]